MDRLRRADNPAAEGLRDRLMPQAHPQDGQPRVELPHQLQRAAGLPGAQGPGERTIASGARRERPPR